ncbi:MAG TPA: molybdopterin-dependent oxidoreductase [Methylobacterium sp.]|jgi:DMSO/TMAO reductase YedYZ molybdopterin-dependent catalytic subunit|uniref:molybdopterin-dependent oxidoreductase n=1 Tax=Methylorubrum sp. B1-46 TaxID=2897334 RepID=UPI001E56078E|nr:molybdopterin-dependent oxidoreductase [Methylorubrum sp. B1-46]UGB24533.1 molybdopterin-dependent oxidoreductase [Methylorubrum sp. B1-46]HEV2542593.1 molybdopterin-dependent oxidoreductase [Methylobacterium sp.]
MKRRVARPRLHIPRPHRRGFLTAAVGLLGAAALGGCDRFAASPTGQSTLKLGEDANLFVQRLLLTPASLAKEFPDSEISPWFKPNGTIDPPDRAYKALAAKSFEAFRLRIDGLVERPQDLSLSDLRALPARTQTTRHDCVEGWSAIGKWTGVPLSEVLQRAGLKPNARYVVFHCADTMEYAAREEPEEAEEPAEKSANPGMEQRPEGAENQASDSQAAGLEAPADEGDEAQGIPVRYYESIDLTDAYHPQTILAYDLNGQALPVSNGAPLRLRVERQLGYKQAKYIMRIEVTESLKGIGDGGGGYWEDRGYEWYAGI